MPLPKQFPPPPPPPLWATYIPGRYSGSFKMHQKEHLAKLSVKSGFRWGEWIILHWIDNKWEIAYEGDGTRELPWEGK